MSERTNFKVGEIIEVEVIKIANYGAFVKLPDNCRGLIHISQVSDNYVKDINEFLKVGDKVKAKLKTIASDGKIDLTLKKEPERREYSDNKEKTFKNSSFEDKLKAFLKKSDERRSDLKRNLKSKGADY
ncbi:MAG: S1 RNA-binding domain-containing protein [Candidatus Omnitrophota bacterium]